MIAKPTGQNIILCRCVEKKDECCKIYTGHTIKSVLFRKHVYLEYIYLESMQYLNS